MISPQSVKSAEAVIQTYEEVAGMEGDKGIQIWHLLFALMDYCEVNNIDFDATLRNVRQERPVINA